MKKHLYFAITLWITLLAPITAFANSSWVWLTNARPIYILPVAALLTIAAETAITDYAGKVNKPKKTLLFVLSANLLSFAAPYISYLWHTPPYSLDMFIENTPSYIVTPVFLCITLLVEIPVVFFALRKDTKNKWALFLSVTASNTLTTLMVALIEKILCKGAYM